MSISRQSVRLHGEEEPVLVAYKQRCEARPTFTKALADQMTAFGS